MLYVIRKLSNIFNILKKQNTKDFICTKIGFLSTKGIDKLIKAQELKKYCSHKPFLSNLAWNEF